MKTLTTEQKIARHDLTKLQAAIDAVYEIVNSDYRKSGVRERNCFTESIQRLRARIDVIKDSGVLKG